MKHTTTETAVGATSDVGAVAPIAEPAPARRLRRRCRLRVGLITVLVLAVATVVVDRTHPYGVSVAHPLGQHSSSHAADADNAAATSTATVTRSTLEARTSLGGALGYAGDYTVTAQGHGTITWLPAPGEVIRQGDVLYRADGAPVVLLYGSTPAYRALAEGSTADAVTGADVAQLNHDLVALGYGRDVGLDPSSDQFSWATKAAVEQVQKALGVKQTGQLGLGQVVFLPSAVRVTSLTATLGGPAGGEVLKATSTTRQVTVNLNAAQQSELKVGDKVTITLPNGQTTPGTVSAVGNVASTSDNGSNSASTVEVDIIPADAAATGSLDQAPVQVTITTGSVRDALVVPVTALLALAGGGYAIEVVATDGTRHLVPVSLGLFDDAQGLVQVTGSGLSVGQRVVVSAS